MLCREFVQAEWLLLKHGPTRTIVQLPSLAQSNVAPHDVAQVQCR